jgi:calcineurin-like phosphoesterase family protein/iron/zinc purple acid phosphatase-like protein C
LVFSVAPLTSGAAPASFTFGAVGDFGATAKAAATLTAMGRSGLDFSLAVGDLTYNQIRPESAWCNFVKNRVGANHPFEVVAGNHDMAPFSRREAASIDKLAACLPHRLGALTGRYGKQYHFDYPAGAPLARVIAISPDLRFPDGVTYRYGAGSVGYRWLANAIDGARAEGIRWVIVAMHKNCIGIGVKSCEIGADALNLMVSKKVDLILQGHEHAYERSKQLAHDASTCPAMAAERFDSGCIVDDGADNTYTKGRGPIVVIAGTGGQEFRGMNTGDPEAKYFARLMGAGRNPTFGFVKYTVTPTQLSAQFVRSAGGNFTDGFAINAPAPPPPR